jgi:hypothetical protein
MKIKGKLIKVLDPQEGVSKTGKNWKKQEFIIDTGSEYNNELCIAAFGDTMDMLQGLVIGDELECLLNISSREYNGRYYHNITAWKIDAYTQDENGQEDSFNEVPF